MFLNIKKEVAQLIFNVIGTEFGEGVDLEKVSSYLETPRNLGEFKQIFKISSFLSPDFQKSISSDPLKYQEWMERLIETLIQERKKNFLSH